MRAKSTPPQATKITVSYMLVTGGRPEISVRSSIPYPLNRKPPTTRAIPARAKVFEARGKLAIRARKPRR